MSWRSYHPIFIGAVLFSTWRSCAWATTVLVSNQSPIALELYKPESVALLSGKTWVGQIDGSNGLALRSSAWDEPVQVAATAGSFAAVVVHGDSTVSTYDANDVQLHLSAAAHACKDMQSQGDSLWYDCLSGHAFGGAPSTFISMAFRGLWQDYKYWWLCEAAAPAQSVRDFNSDSGYRVEILREKPLIAAVRGFVNSSDCGSLMGMFGKDELTRAHVGSGGGATATSEARETLTKNMFVDWGADDVLTMTSVKTFDIASELLGEKIPYEGQEPVNFLHYLRGFEYKPHQDGRAERLGKRVATTLVYCEAASAGGATVFPAPGVELKFAPGAGDLLFFAYAPRPRDALHAACPVVEGHKSTLTQWHRLGVSVETPWDNFEDWGRFYNPQGSTRWKGKRYASDANAGPGSSEL